MRWLLFVITHSCDLLQDVRREPFIEVIAGRQVDRTDPQCVNGRNPRVLHLAADSTDFDYCLAFEAQDRIVVDKELFRNAMPAQEGALNPPALRTLSTWIAKRYHRAAFPDEFNRRLDAASRKLENLWKNPKAEAITGIYVAGAQEELPANRDYVLEVRLSAPSSVWDEPNGEEALEYVVGRLEQILGDCNGIGEVDVHVVPEEDFPISDLRFLKRLDKDYRTFPENESAGHAPAFTDEI